MGAGVGDGVGAGVAPGVGAGVGDGVGAGVGDGVGAAAEGRKALLPAGCQMSGTFLWILICTAFFIFKMVDCSHFSRGMTLNKLDGAAQFQNEV